jgi:hypothetical protein
MEEQFVRKTYRSIALAWVIAMTWTLALGRPWIALSITVGTVLGTAVLATYDHVVRKAFVPGAARPGRALLKLGLVKYPLIGAILYAIVRWDKISLPALCGGIVLVHLAILAKLAGIRMVERRMQGRGEI